MALDSDNVRVALTGAVYVAPVGTPVPSTLTEALDGAFVDLGYLSDDGATVTPSIKADEITAWQNEDIVRRTITRTHEIKFTLIETTLEGLKLAYASAASTSGSTTTFNAGSDDGKRAVVIDCLDGTSFVRHVAPVAQLTDVGDLKYKNGDPVGYELTMAVYKVGGIDVVHLHPLFA